MKNREMTQARVYITTDKKCNEDVFAGGWLELIHFKTKEEFKTACLKLHTDEQNPKLIYFESENIPRVYVSEQWIEPALFELIRKIAELEQSIQMAFSVWLNHFQPDLASQSVCSLINLFKTSYEGMSVSRMQFTYHYAEEQLGITKQNNRDFQFASLASFLFLEDYLFLDGYVFKSKQ